MSERSIIFFDIDGTLLDDNKELPSSAKESIFTLKEKGHEVAIATGRAPFMFRQLREELDIRTFVSYNGQYVVLNDEVIYENPMDMSSLEELVKVAFKEEHPIVFMDHNEMRTSIPDHDFVEESIKTLKIDQFPTHDPHFYKGRNIYQCLLFCEKGEERYYEDEFHDFDFIRWHRVSTDILPSGGSKAIGIQKIVERMGISTEKIYAFGDGLNDIDMLSKVTNSVAMGNGVDEVKRVAKYVTKSADNHGIYHGLQLLGLID